jgi:hypothetical protein
MSPSQFSVLMDELGVTVSGVARLLRLNASTVRRWGQRGCNDVRTKVLLRLLVDNKISFKDIETRAK